MNDVSVLEPSPVVGDDGPLFEIIDGQKMELPPMSAYAGVVAFQIASRIDQFARPQKLGQAAVEVLFHLPLPVDRNRRPDSAYVSYQRWPKGRPIPGRDNAWDVVPELAIEVASPSDLADELMTKIDEYFRAGVQLVWVVYPLLPLVQVYESLTQVRGLTRTDELDGGSVLPGFRVPLAELFPEAPPSEAP